MNSENVKNGIAVIGMACRFPGAENKDIFWENLKNGVESITRFSDQELEASGIPCEIYNQVDYVRKGFIIEDEDKFDAAFFGYSPREAKGMDPQHRLFLETAWKALEDGGYPPGEYHGSVGMFAGSKISTYLLNLLGEQKSLHGTAAGYQTLIGNDKDYLATRASYKMNLKGPSVAVQCACSTSLVAVHFACESVLNGECDMALAGGVSISVPQKAGYVYQKGMMFSPDGHCRAFDEQAKGMVPGNGVGVVVLKNLEKALQDNDYIYAVVRGTAVNNSGSSKTGYTAPSLEGQSKVIRESISVAEIDCESISYVETFGTGTELGDPIEIEAISDVFRAETDEKGFCAIGSVKTNIGHLDAAAGIASFIKTVLSLQHAMIPPSLNFIHPNPKINFDATPFFVNTQLSEWQTNGAPKRAGVSSFGFGGTNAHAILEQAPQRSFKAHTRSLHLLTLSAKTPDALTQQIQNYDAFLSLNEVSIDDVCFTANTGRSHFQYRFAAIAASSDELRLHLCAALEERTSSILFKGVADNRIEPEISFDLSRPPNDADQLTDIASDAHVLKSDYRLPLPRAGKTDCLLILSALGRLYVRGANIDWATLYNDANQCRIPLPTYPFDRQSHWITQTGILTSSEIRSDADSAGNHSQKMIWQEKDDLDVGQFEESSGILTKLRKISSLEFELVLEYLRDQVSKILNISKSQISGTVNLMQLGMDSLLFLELSKIIETDLKISIVPKSFIQSPHINALGKVITGNMKKLNTKNSSPKEDFFIVSNPDNRYVPFGLTDIQHAYWIGRSGVTELGNVACHVYFEINTQGLDLNRYTAAWQQVVSRHDMLRAIILPDGRQQVLKNPPRFQIPAQDLSVTAPDMILQQTMLTREEMSHQVRPTDQWPLFEVRATILDGYRTLLHISMDILIADGYSIYNLMQEIDHYYRMPDHDLAPIECTFRDYVLAESSFRESDTYQRAEQYWMDNLKTLPPPPELPLAKSPSELEQTRFVRREARLEPKAWERLKSYAAQSGLTRANVLLSAYAEVLAIWSKSREFTLNLTFFHRLQGHPRINEVIGDFTSLILLRVSAAHDTSFMACARQIQEQLWKDMEFRYFSGVRVLQELSRNQGARTLMPVVFTSNLGYENLRPEGTGLSLPGKMVYGISQTPQVWIDNQVSEDEDGLVIVWDAVEDLFPAGMLDHMFNAYHGLLKQLAQSKDAWHTGPCLLPEEMIGRRRKVNATTQPVFQETLNGLFIRQAEQQPDHTAVITSSCRISYKDLYHQSMVIAALLANHGATATLVAVVMEKGWEQIAAVLGILNSGAAYLPIDPALPQERLRHLLKNCDAKVVLTQSWLEQKLAWPEDIKRFAVDVQDYTRKDVASVRIKQTPDDLAYVIHTSGSTGVPKGVMIDHIGAVNTILDINNRFNVTREDTVFVLSNLNFDLSVYDIFGTLAAGATIVMPDDALRKDPGHWLSLIKTEHVTIWNSVPALMQMLLEYVSGRDEYYFDTLRLILLSGDWIPLDLPDKIKKRFDPADIISLGGATEASIWSILYPVNTVDPNWNSIPYGRPMVNQDFYVLNENMDPCPDWVPGQLYIGGTGLAKGYWRDGEKTKASFIQNPKTGTPLYRTGDLGRFLPDGNIEFLGREDQQVKINGYRIELGEIESGLKQIDGITDAVVVPITDHEKNRYLAGHVIAESEYGYTDKDLKQNLEQALPGYMVPGFYLFHDAFPVTVNGKIDRKKLADPANISFQKNNIDIVKPENETEQTVSDIIKDMLCLEKVSTKSLFSEIGATSMHFVQMQNKLNKIFAKNISVVNIFEYPTIASLARFINEIDNDSGTGDRTDKRIAIRKRLKKRKPGLMTR